MKAAGLDTLSTYGIMRESDERIIRREIDHLLYLDALTQTEGSYPLLRLGAAARPILRGETTVTMRVPQTEMRVRPVRAAKRKRRANTDADEGLFGALRKLRRALADEAKLPAYMIFSDAALRDMAAKMPRTPEEMLGVSGVGQAKLERYGDAFLNVITQWNRE